MYRGYKKESRRPILFVTGAPSRFGIQCIELIRDGYYFFLDELDNCILTEEEILKKYEFDDNLGNWTNKGFEWNHRSGRVLVTFNPGKYNEKVEDTLNYYGNDKWLL